MIGIARIADRGPTAAAAIAAALLLGGLLSFPIIGAFIVLPITLSSAVVAFVILRRGEAAALRAGGICLLMLVVVSLVMLRSALAIPVAASFSWLPAIAAALVLRRSGSLAVAILAASSIGVASVALLSFTTGDPVVWWSSEIERMLGALVVQGGMEVAPEDVASTVAMLAWWMTGAAAVWLFVTALAALFVARYWQAQLTNPGGFRTEFHALSLGKPAALVSLATIAIAAVFGGPVTAAIAMVVSAAFVVQGLSVVHALIASRGLSGFWLYGVYGLLVVPQTWLLLAALGLLDNQIVFRRG